MEIKQTETKQSETKPQPKPEAKPNDSKPKNARETIEKKMEAAGVTKRTLYSGVGIFGCLLVTVVMSITGIGFNPDVFFTWNYWTGMIIQFAISIFSMITGQQIGEDIHRNNPNSQYRIELRAYRSTYEVLDQSGLISYFDAWLTVYRAKKLEKKIEQTLLDLGMKQKQVLDLDMTEIYKLDKPFRKDWTDTPYYEKYLDPKTGKSETVFKSLSEEQIEALKWILQGKVTLAYISPSYFLNALNESGSDEWDSAAAADKRKPQKMVSGYTYKLFTMLVISAITNGIFASPYDDGGSVWLSIASRIFALITSTVWGVFLGFQIVKMDTVYLSYKSYILKLCHDDCVSGRFKPETIEEQALRELEEYESSVVVPEVVTEEPSVPLIEHK